MNVLDRTFHALAHPTRRRMLEVLAGGERNVTHLAEEFDCSLNVVSKHIMVMEQAGLVRRNRRGRVHQLRFEPVPLREAAEFVEKYRQRWEGKLDHLADYLDTMATSEPANQTSADARTTTSRHRL